MIPEVSLGPFKIEQPDAFLALILGFLILLWLAYKYAYPMGRDLLKARTERIEQAYKQADALLAEAQAIHDDYAQRLAHIEEEHRARVEQAVREAEALSAQIIAEAQQAAQTILQRAQQEVERERTYHQILMRQQIVAIVLDAAENAIRTMASEETQHKLVSDFIHQLAQSALNGYTPVNRNSLAHGGGEP
ncbi:ATP synthase F0 subcomplex B subunit [Chthonomonas calidirosea]|uniref:ATP synthase subunit b n=1 Tax=Chthonomonas calidirosea (strain DSM 23976 / ICMP 18418 / T49) TaxID=1303518 RepID=S0ESV3_CHTCT|nr:ATP synthase F0 subunit B [Chthonomonas calidirosea]CCW34349.1 ATP synthase F0 subcomplex B subunit [Chthonomonas calidirosea T49]CEK15028.1 ATP synthase F0 subcomplex B subunit [Chthonomonas calidirosea]